MKSILQSYKGMFRKKYVKIYLFLRVKSSIKKITLPYGFMVSLSYHT